jgi:quercetin dioxygenase-like cupin family protein
MAPPLTDKSLIPHLPTEGKGLHEMHPLSLLVVTLPFGSVLADAPKSKNAKVNLVYQHELPNVPGKSLEGVPVEYGPGGYSPGHTHAKSALIYATVLEGAIRSQVNDGPVTTYGPDGASPSCPATTTPSAPMPADKAGQAPRGVRGGHEPDGTDDPVRELRS